ncbi:cell division protein ZapD [Kangiella sediminilitoris]|uniref:Cell division protein ZapD n=1 Tax=Kangiella sediminilitoris TaxID=1144748 RepID=A0A1B3BCI0_9GAMM|nr:cell division protein ZapD [Kangiella sediminilitoris]AOE50447.1 Cell division protein ZapD [Kangiella sediminilitoris]
MSESGESILYEHPLSEQVRTYLRLERLFSIQLHLREQDSKICHVTALRNLWEILDCLDRGDIKGELIKELEAQRIHFQQLKESPYIDSLKLQRFLEQLEQLLIWLGSYQGKFGFNLRTDRFIEMLKNRIRMPGGTCSFDLPELHLFLNKPFDYRQNKFIEWFAHLEGLAQCIKILLRLFRENSEFETVNCHQGVYQSHLSDKHNPQLIRIRLPIDAKYYPEVSGSKHYFSIRFMEPNEAEVKPVTSDFSFELAIC